MMDYSKTACVLWGAFQNMMHEITPLKSEVTMFKNLINDDD